MKPVLQSTLPPPLWCDTGPARLPGIKPLAPDDWLWVDDAFAGQMALRDRFIAGRPSDVLAAEAVADDAAQELLQHVLAALDGAAGYVVSESEVKRPDGVAVALDWQNPLATAGRLVQEDLCVMQQTDDQHILTGAVLCFPAGWTLREKLGRPLLAIHTPVASYSDDIARRVHRLFDAIRPEQPLWRLNGFFYEKPDLYAPFSEAQPRPKLSGDTPYFRAERQCLLRLPVTRAVVFSIHTFMLESRHLTATQAKNIQDQIGRKSVV